MPSTATNPVSVIANISVDLSALPLNDVRAIFTMKKRQWANGKNIQVYVLDKDQSTHKEFCKRVLGVFPRQLQSIWHRLVFSGTGQAPIVLDNEEEMLKIIASTEGAIGYINKDKNDEDIKALTIIK